MDGIDEEQYGFPLVPCGPLNAKDEGCYGHLFVISSAFEGGFSCPFPQCSAEEEDKSIASLPLFHFHCCCVSAETLWFRVIWGCVFLECRLLIWLDAQRG